LTHGGCMSRMEALVQSLDALHVDDLDDQACQILLHATLSLERKLLARIQRRHVAFLADTLRIVLPVCERYTQYYGGDGSSQNSALALALTCVAFRDEIFHHFPRRSSDGKRFKTGLQVQSVSRLRWARDLGGPWNYHVCSAAAEQGMADVLEFAMSHGCPWDPYEIAELAVPQDGQSIQMLRCVVESGAEINMQAFGTAAQAGRRDAIEYLLRVVRDNLDDYEDETTFGFGTDTCSSAAMGGHLEVLQWLRTEEECDWDENTCTEAAKNGHLHVLAWAREHGCRWDSHTRRSAAQCVARTRCMEPPHVVDRYLACLRSCEDYARGGRGRGYLTFTPFRWLPMDLPEAQIRR